MISPKYSTAEIKVGFFLAFCLALLVILLASYGRLLPLWRGRAHLHVIFADVAGLRPDSPVRYNGVEVGRVKWMRLLHLDDESIARLPPLTKADLENLPLWPESLVKELRAVGDEDFNARCRQALKHRTVIELCLEVLQEGDPKRYRLDDQFRIVSTVFGDGAVEIMSGNGAMNPTGARQLIIGDSGDFFSNLAKSMGEVKAILSGVTDVVGTQEIRSFERASARFSQVSDQLDRIRESSRARAEITQRKFDTVEKNMDAALTHARQTLKRIEPEAQKAFENIKVGMKRMQDQVQGVREVSEKAGSELSADLKRIRTDLSLTIDETGPHLEPMRANMKIVYDKMGGLSGQVDAARETAGVVLVQSEPDLQRMRVALNNSLTNLKQTGQAANENKDLMLSRSDVGEYEYHSALDIYRRMTMATRRMVLATAEVQDVVGAVYQAMPAPPPLHTVAINGAEQALPAPEAAAFTSRAQAVLEQLAQTRGPLEAVRNTIEEKMLPPFTRKKAAWPDEVPAR